MYDIEEWLIILSTNSFTNKGYCKRSYPINYGHEMLKTIITILLLTATIVIGNILYYYSGIFKKMGITSSEEMNDSDLVVSEEGELIENFPDEIISTKEAKTVNIFGETLFILIASLLWIYMGLTVGYAAFSLQPSELMKLLTYFIVYFFFLRIPFGVVNRTIKKSYEIKVMPEKLLFAILMMISYIIGINYSENLPYVLKWQYLLFENY